MAATLLDSIQNKYGAEEDNQEDYGWIVFVSNSPECKKGMFPPIMTLSDYDISTIGKKLYELWGENILTLKKWWKIRWQLVLHLPHEGYK